jgi:hypothetical protein
MRGDILTAAGRSAEARTAYTNALARLDPRSPYRNYVQVKLDTLGGAVTPPASAAGAAPAVTATTAPAAAPAAAPAVAPAVAPAAAPAAAAPATPPAYAPAPKK